MFSKNIDNLKDGKTHTQTHIRLNGAFKSCTFGVLLGGKEIGKTHPLKFFKMWAVMVPTRFLWICICVCVYSKQNT